jgi:Rad3-related DNA helicase
MYKSFFPYPEYRPQQEDTIKQILYHFKETDDFILESPTGVGKSVIGYTIGQTIIRNLKEFKIDLSKREESAGPKVLICTSTMALQKQYEDELSQVISLWSAKNYTCAANHKIHYGHLYCNPKKCKHINSCQYLNQKKKFLNSNIGVTNYSYFLHSCKLNPIVLICDEAHNIDKILCDYATVVLNKKDLQDIELYGAKYCPDEDWDTEGLRMDLENIISIDQNLAAIKQYCQQFDTFLSSKISNLKDKLKNHKNIKNSIINLIDNLNRQLEHNRYFINSNLDNWIISELDNSEFICKVKPLNIQSIYKNNFNNRSSKRLFMSATICGPSTFSKELGINDNFNYKFTKSSIPVRQRTVQFVNCGNLNYKNKQELLPKFVNIIDQIISKLTNDFKKPIPGIIHSVSYDNAWFIKNNSKYKKYIFIPTKDNLLNFKTYMKKNKNNIIVSPSILEGVDLYDDLSRYQIFLKIPFDSLGDKWVKEKLNRNKNWYSRNAIIKLVQGCGRSIRNEQDWARTFILDSNLDRMLKINNKLFPKWFLESIVR